MKNKEYMKNISRYQTLLGVAVLLLVSIAYACKDNETKAVYPPQPEKEPTRIFSSNYDDNKTYDKLTVDKSIVYTPVENQDWQYSHHPSIVYYKGKYIVIFSNGIYGEDEGNQRVAISMSTDLKTWTPIKVLKDCKSSEVLTPGGLLITDQNTLVAYYTRNDFNEANTRPNQKLFALTSEDGEKWSESIDLGIGIFPCHRPTILSSGRIILTGNRNIYYTDDKSGVAGWTLAKNSAFRPGESASLVEGAIIEHSDSTYILFRDAQGVKAFWQESSLDGKAWTTPIKTNFPNDDTKCHLGQFPDGRYYFVGTPNLQNPGNRTPLILSISDDGYSFDKHYVIANDHYAIKFNEGRWKNGQFGYPYSIIKDDYMYVICSRRKETIEVIKFSLKQL